MRVRFSSTEKFTCYSGIRSQHETEALLNYSRFDMYYNNLNESKNVLNFYYIFRLNDHIYFSNHFKKKRNL